MPDLLFEKRQHGVAGVARAFWADTQIMIQRQVGHRTRQKQVDRFTSRVGTDPPGRLLADVIEVDLHSDYGSGEAFLRPYAASRISSSQTVGADGTSLFNLAACAWVPEYGRPRTVLHSWIVIRARRSSRRRAFSSSAHLGGFPALGHTNIQTTLKHYARFLPAVDERNLKLLDEFAA